MWASRNIGLLPVSVGDGVEAPASISERANIVYERQRTKQSATERRASATKRVASVPTPQMNRHLVCFDRAAVVDERKWTCLGKRQPSYHENELKAEPPNCMTFFYGSELDGVTTVFWQKPPMCNNDLTLLGYWQLRWATVVQVWFIIKTWNILQSNNILLVWKQNSSKTHTNIASAYSPSKKYYISFISQELRG